MTTASATRSFPAPPRPTPGAGRRPPPPAAPDAAVETALDAIRKEGLTGRQLRVARRLAQRHNLPATSIMTPSACCARPGRSVPAFLHAGTCRLDPTVADAPPAPPPLPPSGSRALTPLPGDGVKLPQTVKPIQLPSTEQRAEVNHAAEILKMQQEIARRRKKKLILLAARMMVFVACPRFWRPGISA